MKTLIIFFLAVFYCQLSYSQTFEGVIHYTEEIKNLRAEKMRERFEARGMKIDIPDSHKSEMNLYFTQNKSVYKKVDNQEDEYKGVQRSGGFRIRFMFGSNGLDANGYYRDLENNRRIQQEEILGKKFLILDDEYAYKWKITGRKEQIGRYEVLEAIAITEKDTIQAWFTPQIPVATGPAEFSQLPGVILRVDVNQGNRIIYATTIEIRELTKSEIFEKPSKGKKVSQEEFIAIRKKKKEQITDLYGEERAKEMMNGN